MTQSNRPRPDASPDGATIAGSSYRAKNDGPGPRVMSASTLEGDEVLNRQGEKLGKVEEIMLDVPTGRIAYAVLASGGFLGIGDKLFAIPAVAHARYRQQVLHPRHREGTSRGGTGLRQGPLALDGRRAVGAATPYVLRRAALLGVTESAAGRRVPSTATRHGSYPKRPRAADARAYRPLVPPAPNGDPDPEPKPPLPPDAPYPARPVKDPPTVPPDRPGEPPPIIAARREPPWRN